ncbi:hypothetical protein M2152_001375 [Microbacteriaceae bacterium SG_E_30_P1]|uniref:Modulator of FtsH protease n=1 Tax=Antiquaquibacter oligotrophicus TaxID=2880260 RepID=A0ABT6KP10_9MICO|nr:hypothetical protein [Antiquaquibacter oligotrophicus]MDH6181193.1 hypothetical protein [Antiquaquibacter oligotrophicus]UDF13112.1 hypothetical protein LH407_13265 [Antiquaquibacter oligotrophicus]
MDISDWSELFVAAAGASAALAGLIIVAMSVNVDVIVASPSMPSRAGATISVLVLATLISIVALIPGLSVSATGWVILVIALAGTVLPLESAVRLVRDKVSSPLAKSAVLVIPTLAMVVGGVVLVTGDAAGLYWVVAGIVLGFVGTVLNAWVVLIELRR